MKIPKWKYWASYITDIHLESTDSDFNQSLHVVLSRGRLQLLTDNAIYSFAELYVNFFDSFKQLPLERMEVKNVLILGLGLGSIPYMLEKYFTQNYHFTIVEIDEEVVYLANKYVLGKLDSSIEVVCTDAFAFMSQHQEQYDMVCMDIFIDDVIPSKFEDSHFLNLLKKSLTPKGILLYNRLYLTSEDKVKTEDFFYSTFQKTFPSSTYLDVRGNWMLLNRSINQ